MKITKKYINIIKKNRKWTESIGSCIRLLGRERNLGEFMIVLMKKKSVFVCVLWFLIFKFNQNSTEIKTKERK